MMKAIAHPLILEGTRVKLVPLDNMYFDELVHNSRDPRIWEFLSIDGSPDEILKALKSALLKRMNGEEYTFIIIDREKNKVIGCTRYMEISREFRKLEIGWTWYIPEYWGSGHNTECKYLLLKYAFEELDCIRVQLKTWDKNIRSRTAIQKIGAQFEGILRNERIRYDGMIRSTAMYSIIIEEWPAVKQMLENKINNV